MTVVDGVGTGPQTKIKLENFHAIARMWSKVTWNVFQLPKVKIHGPQALYVDATAGPGLRNGNPSCCIHFLDAMRWYRLSYWAVLIEKDSGICSELSSSIGRYPNVTALWGDYRTILEDTGRFPAEYWQFGMLYVDPNGPSELHFDAIARFCNRMPHMDFLTYVSATALKRYWNHQIRLSSVVGTIPKERWFARLPAKDDPAQWTFLLGTGKHSPIKEYAKVNLFGIDDPRLADAWFRMEHTIDEQKKMLQPDLFTEPTPNICAIQPTGQYVPWPSNVREASASDARRDL